MGLFPFGFTFRRSLVGLGKAQTAAPSFNGTNWAVATTQPPDPGRGSIERAARRSSPSRQDSFAGQTKPRRSLCPHWQFGIAGWLVFSSLIHSKKAHEPKIHPGCQKSTSKTRGAPQDLWICTWQLRDHMNPGSVTGFAKSNRSFGWTGER